MFIALLGFMNGLNSLLAGLLLGILGSSALVSGLASGRFEVGSMQGFLYLILAMGGISVIVGVAMQLILDQ